MPIGYNPPETGDTEEGISYSPPENGNVQGGVSYNGSGSSAGAVADAAEGGVFQSAGDSVITNSLTYASLAKLAQLAAEAAQAAAEASEANAASSEESALTSAATATTKADEADASASSAAISATQASSSATTAEGWADDAEASATAASTSASSAATSATSAAVSAGTATTQAAAAASSASSASDSATSAAEAFDSFDDIYLGNKLSDPLTNNDGDVLSVGALYFNTSTNSMKVWTGSEWLPFSIIGALIASNNLSDLSNTEDARNNLSIPDTTLSNYILSDGTSSGVQTIQSAFELEQTKVLFGGNY